MPRSFPVLAFAVSALGIASGCNKEAPTPAATGSSASPAATTAATAPGAATPAAPTASAPQAEPAAANAAASFPATELPTKALADYTIGLPPGGKLKAAGDRASLETADFRLMLKPAKKNDLAEIKPMFQKMPGFKALTVDQPDGIVMEVEEKGAKQFVLTRFVTVGDKLVTCESALTKPPKDEAKAKEAFDICGTIKKK